MDNADQVNVWCINWRAPWKNRTSRYISFFCPSLNGVLFPISVYWWKGSVRL